MSILIGKKAPDFTVPAVLGNNKIVENFNLMESIKDKYGLVFFYPLDFTFVCPSELIALDNRFKQFEDLNVAVIGISIDSHFTHNAWRNTPVSDGGIGHVKYTLASDMTHSICRSYGVQATDLGGLAYRGAFLIDRSGIIRAQMVNDLPIGRNIDEIIRLFEAIQFHEENGDVCPSGWMKGDIGIKESSSGISEYLGKYSKEL
jgi:peroxiredoxin (alkyl hydroperoxide reductase subunit C)